MRFLTTVAAAGALACLLAAPAFAGPGGVPAGPFQGCSVEAARPGLWSIDFAETPVTVRPQLLRLSAGESQAALPRRPLPVEYSEGYKTRAKIHKISSFATLPLFVANYFVGQDLYDNPGQSESNNRHGWLSHHAVRSALAMAAPEFLVHATQGWARLYADSKAVSTGVMYIHLAGLLLGGGAAVAADRETLTAAGEADPVRVDHLAFLGTVHATAIAGLAMLAISGAAMLLADVETFWGSKVFWIKMCLVALLLANGLMMQQAERLARTLPTKAWRQLRTTSILSLVLWFAILLASTILASS